jgi:ATP-dependent protease ClpP protease subunit
MVAELACLRDSGAKALLLTVNTGGGNTGETSAICDALRAFSRDVGPVVTYVSEWCGSSGPRILLSGDYVLLDPRARLNVHAAIGGTPEDRAAVFRQDMAFFEAHTLTPGATLEHLLSRTCDGLGEADWRTAETAFREGWCEGICSRVDARAFAERLTDPSWKFLSTRKQALAARRAGIEVSQ